MTDSYTTLLQMIADSKPLRHIALVTGWSVEAIKTLREELEYNKRDLAA